MPFVPIVRRTLTARTSFSAQLEYVCVSCSTRAAAWVSSEGIGSAQAIGGFVEDPEAARDAANFAQGSAEAHAVDALRHAPCPRCGAIDPTVLASFASFNAKVATAKRRALIGSMGVFSVIALAGGVFGARDLAYSRSLLIAVLLGAGAVAALAFAILRDAGKRPETPWGAVRFWWRGEDGTDDWRPPPEVALPPLEPTSKLPIVGFVTSFLLTLGALAAVFVWRWTFTNVYVVDSRDRAVIIDGVAMADAGSRLWITDAHVRRFTARRGKLDEHTAVVGGVTYALPGDGHEGWVVAPDAEANDICFEEYEVFYGRDDGAKPAWKRLVPRNSVIALLRPYDDAFQRSPESVKVDRGQTVRRWSLRTVSCKVLSEEEGPSAQPAGSGAPPRTKD